MGAATHVLISDLLINTDAAAQPCASAPCKPACELVPFLLVQCAAQSTSRLGLLLKLVSVNQLSVRELRRLQGKRSRVHYARPATRESHRSSRPGAGEGGRTEGQEIRSSSPGCWQRSLPLPPLLPPPPFAPQHSLTDVCTEAFH
jgi:hypothetical protein